MKAYLIKLLTQKIQNELSTIDYINAPFDKHSFQQGYTNGNIKGFFFGNKRPMLITTILLIISIILNFTL